MNNYKNLIILDWDDTLFPTSWLVNNNININNPKTQYQYLITFSKLDIILYKLFSKLIRYGQVVIVTNAVSKWISLSLEMLPNSGKIINKKVIVMSARDIYQEMYPNEMDYWKKLLFRQIVNKYFSEHKLQNIISIGDAEYEFKAIVDLYDEFSVTKKKLLKTIRFIRDPSFDELIDELQVLETCIEDIVVNVKHYDLTFKQKIKI